MDGEPLSCIRDGRNAALIGGQFFRVGPVGTKEISKYKHTNTKGNGYK